MRDFRFSFVVHNISSRDPFVARCRRAEKLGYDAVYVSDHLGGPAPFPALVSAAEATEQLRVGTLVLNSAFWNSHLLAREVATVDKLTDGRLDLGMGAGHMKWEFEAANVAWAPADVRVDRLAATIDDMAGLFAGGGYDNAAENPFGAGEPTPVQQQGFGGYGPPLLIGGASERVLELAARRADIVGYSGVRQMPGEPAGTLRLLAAEQATKQVEFVRQRIADATDEPEYDEPEFQVLVQYVRITNDRRSVAEQLLADKAPYLTVDEVLECPFVLIGTETQVAEQVRANRERFGFSHISVHDPFMGAFAPIIEQLRG